MVDFSARTRAPRPGPRRRLARAGAVTALLLPALLGSTAPPVAGAEPTPGVSPGPVAEAFGDPVGGPRMGERGVVVSPGAPAPPVTVAPTWVVADAETGDVLAAKDPHALHRPASTLKTLLALTMAPRLGKTATVVADQSDADQVGTRVGLVPGQEYDLEDVWYGLMLRSGNDAANAIARAGGGTVERGVRMMNAEARRLQANDTVAMNPSGLDEDTPRSEHEQFSSAYDLALWGRAALQREDLREIVGTLRWTFPGNETESATKATKDPFWVYTENRLMLQDFEGAIGVKTGYTTLAQNTIIAAAERDGRTIIATLMHVPGGHITREAGLLLEYGFANAGSIEPVGELVEPLSTALVSEADDGFTSVSTNLGRSAPRTEDLADSGLGLAGSENLHWSAIAGSALGAVLLVLGAARLVATRRRYRRYGAYR